jgi:hypothetical protein
MIAKPSQSGPSAKPFLPVHHLYALLAPRAYSVIMFGALFCTLAVKFHHAWRIGLLDEYFSSTPGFAAGTTASPLPNGVSHLAQAIPKRTQADIALTCPE